MVVFKIELLCLRFPTGCTLQELWGHVSVSSPYYPLESYTKHFIWRQLLGVMKESPSSLALYRIPNARPKALMPGEDFVPTLPYCMVGCGGGVRGSCVDFDDREDVTTAVLGEQLELQQVEERCGRVRVYRCHVG